MAAKAPELKHIWCDNGTWFGMTESGTVYKFIPSEHRWDYVTTVRLPPLW